MFCPAVADSPVILRLLGVWRVQTLDESQDVISGVAVNIRKQADRVAIWTRTCDEAKVSEVGRRLRLLLGADDKVQIKFQNFEGKALLDA